MQEHSAGCLLVFTHSLNDGAKAAWDVAGWRTCLDMIEATLPFLAVNFGSRSCSME